MEKRTGCRIYVTYADGASSRRLGAPFKSRTVINARTHHTAPQLLYKGAHQTTLDPIAAQRPEGGLFLWSEQGNVSH
jgi:hypothetical protein